MNTNSFYFSMGIGVREKCYFLIVLDVAIPMPNLDVMTYLSD